MECFVVEVYICLCFFYFIYMRIGIGVRVKVVYVIINVVFGICWFYSLRSWLGLVVRERFFWYLRWKCMLIEGFWYIVNDFGVVWMGKLLCLDGWFLCLDYGLVVLRWMVYMFRLIIGNVWIVDGYCWDKRERMFGLLIEDVGIKNRGCLD